MKEIDTVKILLSQNPGIIIQVKDEDEVSEFLLEHGIFYLSIGHPVSERSIFISNKNENITFNIDYLRDKWYRTSYLLDRKQSGTILALERYKNYKKHN